MTLSEILGLPRSSLGLLDLHDLIQKGLPYASLESVAGHLFLRERQLAQHLGIHARTISRRKDEGTFAVREAERIIRVARVLLRTWEVFGKDLNQSVTWMRQKDLLQGKETPLSLLQTDIGLEIILGKLDLIERGLSS